MIKGDKLRQKKLNNKGKHFYVKVPFSYEANRELKPKFGPRTIAVKQTMSQMRRKVKVTLAKVELPE